MAALLSGVLVLWALTWSCGVCLAFYGYKFYKLRHLQLYSKRRGNLVMSYTICASLMLITGIPLIFLMVTEWTSPPKYSTAYLILNTINNFLYFPFLHIGSWLVLCRYWMIYYDIQFANSCLSVEWKKLITSNIHALRKETWFIEHRSTYGNGRKVTRAAVFIGCTISVACIVDRILLQFRVYVAELRYTFYLETIVFILMLITYIIIWKKMPFLNDNIYLYQEFKAISYSWFAAVLVFFTLTFLLHWFQPMTSESPVARLVVLVFRILSVTCPYFVVPFVSTFWVLRKIKAAGDIYDYELQMQPTELSLSEILANHDSLNLFMKHLTDELSMELLLSFIEFHQFRVYAQRKLNVDDLQKTETKTCAHVQILEEQQINLPPDFPDSDIICGDHMHEQDESDDAVIALKMKMKAHKLYRKYIAEGAEFEINISGLLRNKFVRKMHDYDAWLSEEVEMNAIDIAKLFDDCMEQMISLLNSSKQRFQYQRR